MNHINDLGRKYFVFGIKMRHKISPVSLSDAVGQPCEIKAKKEQIKRCVYISTTVAQHLSTYSSSKVSSRLTTFGRLLMKYFTTFCKYLFCRY